MADYEIGQARFDLVVPPAWIDRSAPGGREAIPHDPNTVYGVREGERILRHVRKSEADARFQMVGALVRGSEMGRLMDFLEQHLAEHLLHFFVAFLRTPDGTSNGKAPVGLDQGNGLFHLYRYEDPEQARTEAELLKPPKELVGLNPVPDVLPLERGEHFGRGRIPRVNRFAQVFTVEQIQAVVRALEARSHTVIQYLSGFMISDPEGLQREEAPLFATVEIEPGKAGGHVGRKGPLHAVTLQFQNSQALPDGFPQTFVDFVSRIAPGY